MAKKKGNCIRKSEPLVEILTEKVTVEILYSLEGYLEKILKREIEIVPVHTPIA